MITSYFKAKGKDKAPDNDGETTSASNKRPVEDDNTASTTSSSASDGKDNKRIKLAASASESPADESSAISSLLDHIREPSWRKELEIHFSKNTAFRSLAEHVAKERRQHTIYPPASETFTALNLCALDQVKVVIVGQDPYHGPNQAHGLAFSVGRQEMIPPSLRNIYKELLNDKQIRNMPSHGHLERWAKQGVLLLNTTLTVRSGQANSHGKAGWQLVTDRIIQTVASKRPLVFLLWGIPAKEKTTKALASQSLTSHTVICTSHPSPLGATKTKAPFMGSQCFRRCNEALVNMGHEPIDWNVDGPLP